MRMSALGCAMILQNKGLETVLQVCCRDRNRLALQADLLAAYGCGITSIMPVKGEDITFGDHHQAKAVDDLNRQSLLAAIQNMAQGKDLAGAELAGAPQFFCGCCVNIGVNDASLEAELDRVKQEMDAGVDFFITSPIFDPGSVDGFLDKFDLNQTKVIPKIMMLKSIGMARYIQRNMPHIHVPNTLISRFQRAPDKSREAINTAKETMEALKERGFHGVLIEPMGWENKLSELVE
jgi:5,10-methylenetetrahydrofolate reductase